MVGSLVGEHSHVQLALRLLQQTTPLEWKQFLLQSREFCFISRFGHREHAVFGIIYHDSLNPEEFVPPSFYFLNDFEFFIPLPKKPFVVYFSWESNG